jgi:hypothetical protein
MTYNIKDRGSSYKHNGVFVVLLSCLCGSRILEDALKMRYAAAQSGTHEYLSLAHLKHFFNVLRAKDVLDNVKKSVVDIICRLRFHHTLSVCVYAATEVYQKAGGAITVDFTQQTLRCGGREDDKGISLYVLNATQR